MRSKVTVILQASKQHATAPQHENKRHGHDVQVKHDKTWTLSYLQKPLKHAQKDVARLQIITVSQTWQKITGHGRNNIRLQSWELSNNMLQEHILAKKAWHESTNSLEQKSLTDHEPKRHRRYDGTHVNIASFINRFRLSRKLDMSKTELHRHVCELDALTTRHIMACEVNQQ